MGKWLTFYRIAHRNHLLRAKVAEGGEPYGNSEMGKTAERGQWLCESIENGHRWVCSKESFNELYCEVGKFPVHKKKKQEDGYRKGKSRKRSTSYENDPEESWDFHVGFSLNQDEKDG